MNKIQFRCISLLLLAILFTLVANGPAVTEMSRTQLTYTALSTLCMIFALIGVFKNE